MMRQPSNLPPGVTEGMIPGNRPEDVRWEKMLDEAHRMGTEHGDSAGTWVIDGNTKAEDARRTLQAIEDGDPMFSASIPAPLSGEWSDWPTPQSVMSELGVDEDEEGTEELLDAYVEGYYQAYEDRVNQDIRLTFGFEDI